MPKSETPRISLRVQPNAARSEIVGWYGNALRIRTVAPPTNGRANAAVEDILATALGVPRRGVSIVRGLGSRDKVVEVAGLDDAELQRRLRGLFGSGAMPAR